MRVNWRGKRTGGTLAAPSVIVPRPPVRSEGVELDIVWCPHRDALSLLPADYPTTDGLMQMAGGGLHRRIFLTQQERRTGGSQ